MRALIVLTLACASCGIEPHEHALDGEGGHHGADAGPTTKNTGELIVEAPDAKAPVYLALGGALVASAPSDPLAWDLKFARTMIATNSGTSGSGAAGAVATSFTALDGAITCPTDGYQPDAMLPIPGPPGSGEYSGNPVLAGWFDYDATTHAVSSKGVIYCVRTAKGRYGAIRVRNYTGGKMTVEWRYQPSGAPAL